MARARGGMDGRIDGFVDIWAAAGGRGPQGTETRTSPPLLDLRFPSALTPALDAQIGRRLHPHPGPLASEARHWMDAPNWETASRIVVPQKAWERGNGSLVISRRRVFPRQNHHNGVRLTKAAEFDQGEIVG